MKIACFCLRASALTGSEMYFHTLCESLAQIGHNVTLFTNDISDLFIEKSRASNYKISKEIAKNEYDVAIISHAKETQSLYKDLNCPIVNICHSEIYESERPMLHKNVVKYVGVRDSICQLIKEIIPQGNIQLIKNPIDTDRFNTSDTKDKRFGLFVGTMGGLRYGPALHFSQHCAFNNIKSVYVSAEGQIDLPFFDVCLGRHDNIEELFKTCTVSGGIIFGRTYYEARLCGKPTIEYMINNQCKIESIIYEDAPDENELRSLYNDLNKAKVAKKIIDF